jgi:hypothetical protein
MKIISVGAEWYHADGKADMTKLLVAFRKFVNRSKNQQQIQTIKTALSVVLH